MIATYPWWQWIIAGALLGLGWSAGAAAFGAIVRLLAR